MKAWSGIAAASVLALAMGMAGAPVLAAQEPAAAEQPQASRALADIEWLLGPDRARNDCIDQVVQRIVSERTEHLADLGVSRPDVPTNKTVRVVEAIAHVVSSCLG